MKADIGRGEFLKAAIAVALICAALFAARLFLMPNAADPGARSLSVPVKPAASVPNPSAPAPSNATRYGEMPEYMLVDRISELESDLDEERWLRLVAEEKNEKLSEELERLNSELDDAKTLAGGEDCEGLANAVSAIDEAEMPE